MKPLNYGQVFWLTRWLRKKPAPLKYKTCYKKARSKPPRLSIILLDWTCRERFHTLDWLNRQDVPRDQYELIWVELYKRVNEEIFDKIDQYVICEQKGIYHKHKGYNIGVLESAGELICICDSDAVFPSNFVSSIFTSFYRGTSLLSPLVLMHHQKRTAFTYPERLEKTEELEDEKWNWWRLKPNAGACVTFRKKDVIQFGGFDEDRSFRGYFCGAYDLVWRLINAGFQEVWHDSSTVLWHFAHADPVGTNNIQQSIRQIMELTYPHLDCHALTAVDAFSSGRYLPLKENPQIFTIRMKNRNIGSLLEKKYAGLTGVQGFPSWLILLLKTEMFLEVIFSLIFSVVSLVPFFRKVLNRIFSLWTPGDDSEPLLLKVYRGHSIVYVYDYYYAIPQALGKVDVHDFQKMKRFKSSQSLEEIERQIDAGECNG